MIIVCLGDSITAGYPYGKDASWVQHCADELGINMINAGISNHTTGDMLNRFINDVTPYRPDAVIILGGTNDAWQGVKLSKTQENFKQMIYMTRCINAVPILGLLPPIIKEKVKEYYDMEDVDQFDSHLMQIRNWLKKYAAEEGILLLDFYTPLCKSNGFGNPAVFADGGHPNRTGYKILADSIKDKLTNIIK
ncbi:MAG: hypothetical protein H0Z40_00860 [Desulfotomaculum sp.]|nr:hypothetical protein [Desulfotomaculum sp.]